MVLSGMNKRKRGTCIKEASGLQRTPSPRVAAASALLLRHLRTHPTMLDHSSHSHIRICHTVEKNANVINACRTLLTIYLSFTKKTFAFFLEEIFVLSKYISMS